LIACCALFVGAALCCAAPARAQVYSEELRVHGFWPDIALATGGGIGLDGTLDSNVFARLRLGALYAYEPFIVNLGVVGEVGCAAERGAGLELEINHFGGPFLQTAFERVTRGDSMARVLLGFAIFGVEWQHRLSTHPDNALLFVLRAPIGIWWFLSTRSEPARPPPRTED
jgi:hypothetical protein